MEADEELKLATLEEKHANGLLSEQDYQEQLYNVVQQGLEKRLQLLIDAGQGESLEAKKLQTALKKGESDRITETKKMELSYLKFKQDSAKEGRALLADSLSFLVDNLNKQSAAYVLFKAAMKTLHLAEIGLNLKSELSANAKNAAVDPRNALPGGSAIVGAELAIKNGLSIGRAVKVAAFAKGGNTAKPQELVSIASAAGLISGASGGSFAGGGPVESATLGLIGEAGPELVIPNWLYADPKQANLIGFLEAQIASKGNAFATGGSTTGASAVASPVGDDPSAQLLDVLERIARGQQEFRD
jgi:hypothetical protein